MDFILQRIKAVAAMAVAGLGPLIITAIEKGSSLDIPVSYEAIIIAFFAGLVVHQVPNQKPA